MSKAGSPRADFPKSFVFGTATASYQIEGAVNEDGRGESIWDRFSHTPGKIKAGETGDVACDHYHRVDEDIALMKALGIQAYRFSIAWPRIVPDGDGAVNQAGLDFYSTLVDKLLAAGIQPWPTLYHWDLPQALEDKQGGWRSRATSEAFGRYAGIVVKHLSDRVKRWMTMNEMPCIINLGHEIGNHAPGAKEPPAMVNQIQHNVLRGHGLAALAIRESGGRGIEVGLAHNASCRVPVVETEANIRASELSFIDHNSPLLDPMVNGRYPEKWLKKQGADAPKVEAGDLETISQPLDFCGLNVYTGHFTEAADNADGYRTIPHPPTYPRGFLNWLWHVPQSIYWCARFINGLYGLGPLYVTENGCAVVDELKDGEILDLDRMHYYRMYLQSVARAIRDGYPIEGYFAWTLMDNFEWAEGYSARFGIYYVDFETQQRTPKMTASLLAETIRHRRVM